MKKILFVCLGNICRSPSAEAVMKHLVEKKGLEYEIDSAGTSAYHEGEPADARMRAAGKRRGYNLTSTSRRVFSSDFENFDLLVAMDDENFDDLTRMAKSDETRSKVVKMCDFCTERKVSKVPDPYYGGSDGFDIVLDILEEACEGLINKLNQEKK